MATQPLLAVPAGIGQGSGGIPDPITVPLDWGSPVDATLARTAAGLLTLAPGALRITPAATSVPLTLDAQGTDILDINSGGTVRSFFDVFGNLTVRNNARLDTSSLGVTVSSTASQVAVFAAIAGQATDIIRVKDGTGTTTITITSTGALALTNGIDIAFGTAAGTRLGTTSGQKLAFYGATPIVRAAAYTQTYGTTSRTAANVSAVAPATTASALASFGYTQAQADAISLAVAALVTTDLPNVKNVVNSLINDLRAYGLIP